MPYSKQTWVDYNPSYPASAARFSHIEDGIASAATPAGIAAQSRTNVLSCGPGGVAAIDGVYAKLAGGTQTIGDGSATTLASVYSTLGEAQAVYSFASSLTQTVDWAAWQLAFNTAMAANGGVFAPAPSSSYMFGTSGVSVDANGQLDVETDGSYAAIQYAGASGSVFYANGIKLCRWVGLRVKLSHAAPNGVTVFDFDSNGKLGGPVTFVDCYVSTEATQAPQNCVGWRYGHNTTVGMDAMTHIRCYVSWYNSTNSSVLGNIGWVNEAPNGLVYKWYGCAATYCQWGWTTHSTSGAARTDGGGSQWWYGCGGSSNSIDFNLTNANDYGWYGGRWETGTQFLVVPAGGSVNQYALGIYQISLEGYTSAISTKVIDVEAGGSLIIQGLKWTNPTNTVGANMIFYSTRGPGYFSCKGCSIQNTDPFWTIQAQGYVVADVDGNGVRNVDGTGGGMFAASQITSTNAVTTGYTAGTSTAVTIDGQASGNAGVAVPTQNNGAAVASGGSFTAGTYYWKITATNSAGETTGSNEKSLTLVGNGSANLNWQPVAGAVGYKIYRATAAGAENTSPALVAAVGNVTQYTDTGGGLAAGSVPASNTAATGYTLGDVVGALKKARILAL